MAADSRPPFRSPRAICRQATRTSHHTPDSRQLRQFPFLAAQRGNAHDGAFSLRDVPEKRDGASVRRPLRLKIGCRIGGETQRLARTDQLNINIEIVVLFSIPAERHLIAVGRETWRLTDNPDSW